MPGLGKPNRALQSTLTIEFGFRGGSAAMYCTTNMSETTCGAILVQQQIGSLRKIAHSLVFRAARRFLLPYGAHARKMESLDERALWRLD